MLPANRKLNTFSNGSLKKRSIRFGEGHLHFNHLCFIMLLVGWYEKWVVLTCAFCNYILVNGVIYCFGVLYVELLDSFGEEKDVTAWVGSIQLGLVNLGGKFMF